MSLGGREGEGEQENRSAVDEQDHIALSDARTVRAVALDHARHEAATTRRPAQRQASRVLDLHCAAAGRPLGHGPTEGELQVARAAVLL